MAARSASRRRVSLTVLVTLLIVLSEFAFLSAVYLRAQPARQQRIVAAGYAGELAAATPGASAAAVAGQVEHFAAAMRAAHASSTELAPVVAAARTLAAEPGSPEALSTLHSAADRLSARAAAYQHALDRQAEVIYAGLLVVVSIGWMFWFRRLVARHRGLQRRLTEAEAKEAGERRLGSLVRNSADVIAVCDAAALVSFVTAASGPVLGRPSEELIGTSLLDLVHPDDQGLLVHLMSRPGEEDQTVALRLQHADGRYLRVSGTLANRLGDPDIGGFVATVRDVTAEYELAEQLSHQAFHDSLTGLANRQLFTDRLVHSLEKRGEVAPLVVAFCDLDDFKNVNDTHGHGTGDAVLVEVAARLRGVVRPGDTVARLGGDEFAVLMEATDLAEADGVAARMLESLRTPMPVEGHTLHPVASIGLAQARPGEASAEEILRNADVAMYLAKDRGKSSVAHYDAALHGEALARMALRGELQQAIRDEQFVLYYQATVELSTERVIGFEALVRWQHPERGLVGPGEFIPAAEQSGLIVPLGSWILAEACRAAAAMPPAAVAPYISVNVAAKQLARPSFVAEVVGVLTRTGLAPERLVLEITESDLLDDIEGIAPRLSELRAHGVRVAIDDFGTGYSSLAYLTHLPVDVLKVDKSFVDRIMTSEQDANLTKAIIDMSRTMQFKTVAEGVEHPDQAEWLAAADCALGQGYLWSRPVPFAEAIALVRSDSAAVIPLPVRPTPPGDLPAAG